MHRHVLVALLEAIVLSVVVQVIPPDDDGPLHLELLHHAGKDAPANVNGTGEGAFLVDVSSLGRLKTNINSNQSINQSIKTRQTVTDTKSINQTINRPNSLYTVWCVFLLPLAEF